MASKMNRSVDDAKEKWKRRNKDKFPLKDEDVAREAVMSLKNEHLISNGDMARKIGVTPEFSTWLNHKVGEAVLKWLNSDDAESNVKSDPVPSPEYVYIMGDPEALSGVRFKVGRSNNPDRRRNDFATAFPELQVMYCAKVSDVVLAEAAHKALEKEFHRTREWFYGPFEKIKDIVEKSIELYCVE